MTGRRPRSARGSVWLRPGWCIGPRSFLRLLARSEDRGTHGEPRSVTQFLDQVGQALLKGHPGDVAEPTKPGDVGDEAVGVVLDVRQFANAHGPASRPPRSEEHTSELQS